MAAAWKTEFFSIPNFSRAKSKPSGKNTGRCFSIQCKTTCKYSGTYEEKEKKLKIVTYHPFALSPSIVIYAGKRVNTFCAGKHGGQ